MGFQKRRNLLDGRRRDALTIPHRGVLPVSGVVFLCWWFSCTSAVRGVLGQQQPLDSPCPDTFQYQRDSNGQLYGTIGVYSFEDTVVQLNLQLSVGNVVDSYNGEIQLLSSKNQVVNDLQHLRPIRYKVIFPRWEVIPPKVTRIMVNSQVVCSGPPIRLGGWVTVLTTINLQHTLRLKINTLVGGAGGGDGGMSSLEKDFIQKISNDLFSYSGGAGGGGRPGPNQVVPQDFDIKFNPRPPQNNIKNQYHYQKNPFLNTNGFVATTSTTTPKPTNLAPVDFHPAKNPFLTQGNFPASVPSNPKVEHQPIHNNNGISGFPESPLSTSKNHRKPVVTTNNGFPGQPDVVPRDTTNNFRVPFSDVCGVTVVPNLLVVNGDAVPRGAFPWLAAMFAVKDTGLEYKCSGSLISKKHVVTAAHCVRDEHKKNRPEEFLFVLGKLNIRRWTPSAGEVLVEAQSIHVHPDYKRDVSDADLAVVVISAEVTFTNYIKPICLWSEASDLRQIVGQKGKVVGWGKDENGHIRTEEPKQVTIPVVSQDDCLRSSDTFRYVTSNRTFCAGNRNGSGPCNGDSGSGFVMKRNDRWVLRGVVSISTFDQTNQSCDLTNYVVFTDCSKHIEWLLSFLR